MALGHSPQIVRDGLVLHLDAANVKSYPGSGITLSDLSTISGSGTFFNGPVFESDNLGSINFDGTSDYIRIVRSDLNGGSFLYDEITVHLWVKPALSYGGLAYNNNLITVERSFEISIGDVQNGLSKIAYASEPWAWRYNNNLVITNGEWNHITFTHALSGRKLYVNANEVYSSSETGAISSGTSSYPYLTLMGRNTGTGSNAEGNLSTVQLYSRVLSESEIKQNFEAYRDRYGI